MEKKDQKLNFPIGIFGDSAIPSQKLNRNFNYYGQIREDIDLHIEYLQKLQAQGQKYLYMDMVKQKEDPRRLRFIVVEPKKDKSN